MVAEIHNVHARVCVLTWTCMFAGVNACSVNFICIYIYMTLHEFSKPIFAFCFTRRKKIVPASALIGLFTSREPKGIHKIKLLWSNITSKFITDVLIHIKYYLTRDPVSRFWLFIIRIFEMLVVYVYKFLCETCRNRLVVPLWLFHPYFARIYQAKSEFGSTR